MQNWFSKHLCIYKECTEWSQILVHFTKNARSVPRYQSSLQGMQRTPPDTGQLFKKCKECFLDTGPFYKECKECFQDTGPFYKECKECSQILGHFARNARGGPRYLSILQGMQGVLSRHWPNLQGMQVVFLDTDPFYKECKEHPQTLAHLRRNIKSIFQTRND